MVAFTPTIQGMIELVVYKTGTDESKIDTHVDPEKILLSKETVFFFVFFSPHERYSQQNCTSQLIRSFTSS